MRASENAVKQQRRLRCWNACQIFAQSIIWRHKPELQAVNEGAQTISLMRKSRCALFYERGHAFLLVCSRKQRVKEPALK